VYTDNKNSKKLHTKRSRFCHREIERNPHMFSKIKIVKTKNPGVGRDLNVIIKKDFIYLTMVCSLFGPTDTIEIGTSVFSSMNLI
jgi:hypothetical protein